MANKADKTIQPGGAGNNRIAGRQSKTMVFTIIGVVILLGGLSIYLNRPKGEVEAVQGGASERLTDSTARTPGDAETFRKVQDQIEGLQLTIAEERKLRKESDAKLSEVLEIVRGENEAEQSRDSEFELLQQEVSTLRRELKEQESRPPSLRDATPLGGSLGRDQGGSLSAVPLGPNGFGGQRSGAAIDPSLDTRSRRSQQVIVLKSAAGTQAVEEFDKDVNGDLSKATEPSVFDTEDYVPPNAYAPAKVYVGVDAATGNAAQSDPQAAAFIITGPARHVVVDGEIQETDLTGCIVNGAARGDLSTERVFIKLQKMTCPLADGRVSVQEVEGHVTQLGKAGVRGTIVSRVGDQLNKAAIAGGLSGLGQALGGAGRGGVGVGSGGGIIQEIPNAEELAIAAGGQAVSGAADTLANYYVEQAKAIQPVVAMPTGVDVELVFISGFKARPTED